MNYFNWDKNNAVLIVIAECLFYPGKTACAQERNLRGGESHMPSPIIFGLVIYGLHLYIYIHIINSTILYYKSINNNNNFSNFFCDVNMVLIYVITIEINIPRKI